jgi:hypothetical protein
MKVTETQPESDAYAKELAAFKEAHKNGFDLSEKLDAWKRPVFVSPYMEAMFHGWLKRAARCDCGDA